MAVIPLQAESVRTNPHAYFWARHREYEAAQGLWLADDGEDAETDTRLSDAAYAAEDQLFTTPALSVAGVLAKARVLLLRDDAMATLHSRHVAAILADLQRLALIEAAREGGDHGNA